MVKYTESYILEALDILIVKPHQRRSTSPDQAKKKIIYQTGHQYVLMSRDLEGVKISVIRDARPDTLTRELTRLQVPSV